MKVVYYISIFLGGVALSYLLFSLGVLDVVDGIPGSQKEPALALPTYLGFIATMMTAVTVVLAAVAIGIGIIAAYTFREIKDEAQSAATARVNALVAEKLSDDAIKARINQVAFAQKTTDELEQGFDPSDMGER